MAKIGTSATPGPLDTTKANSAWLNTLYPGAPKNPGYSSLTDEAGNLLPGFKLQGAASLLPQFQGLLDKAAYDPTALKELTSQATATGPSAWASVAQLSNKANTANQMGAAGAQANSAGAAARSALASHGGLRQGAMANLANQGAKSLLSSKQGVLNQGFLNDLGIQSEDAKNKMTMLNQAVSGAQGEATANQNAANLWGNMAINDRNYDTSVQQSNITSLLANKQGQNAFNSNTYNSNLQAWAAKQQADAQTEAGKHSGGVFGGGGFLGLGSWICTEVDAIQKLDAEVIKELKLLRRASLAHAPGRAAFYLNGAGGLLGKMKSDGYDFSKERQFVIAMAELHKKDSKAAVEAYWDRVNELLKEQGF